jgi:ABC-type multidrug transport system fused ATPase/permease subunit
VATVGFATLTQGMINQGMVEGDQEAVLNIGFWMLVLAVVAGICQAIAAGLAVFFSQGTGYYIRSRLYSKNPDLFLRQFRQTPHRPNDGPAQCRRAQHTKMSASLFAGRMVNWIHRH